MCLVQWAVGEISPGGFGYERMKLSVSFVFVSVNLSEGFGNQKT